MTVKKETYGLLLTAYTNGKRISISLRNCAIYHGVVFGFVNSELLILNIAPGGTPLIRKVYVAIDEIVTIEIIGE